MGNGIGTEVKSLPRNRSRGKAPKLIDQSVSMYFDGNFFHDISMTVSVQTIRHTFSLYEQLTEKGYMTATHACIH